MSAKPISALIFDFDGTIIDTETPIYESWRATFEHAGAEPIALDVWSAQIGLAESEAMDTRAVLCERLGIERVPQELEDYCKMQRDEMLAAQPVRDGVVDFINLAEAFGIPLGIGSSSPTSWVESNLQRVGLRDRFEILSCADPGIPGKPDPTVYLAACRALKADPALALAIEDSPNGVAAAVSAGMPVVGAPGPITSGANFSQATVRIDSLALLDAADWLTRH